MTITGGFACARAGGAITGCNRHGAGHSRSGDVKKIAVVIVVSLLCLTFACSQEQQSGKPAPQAPPGPDQMFVDSHFVVTDDGLTSAVVHADSVAVFYNRLISEMTGNVRVDFFNRKGERVSVLTAKRGIVYGKTEAVDSLRAEGDVRVTWRERDATMKTPFIRWNAASRMIYADGAVTLTLKDAVERGVGFEAPDDLKSYVMRSVTGVVRGENIRIPKTPEGR